jgi:hypothetical protein
MKPGPAAAAYPRLQKILLSGAVEVHYCVAISWLQACKLCVWRSWSMQYGEMPEVHGARHKSRQGAGPAFLEEKSWL